MGEGSVSYADIAAAIGEAKALELSKVRGGRELYIPSPERLSPHSPLVALVGPEAAEALARRYSRRYIAVPLTQGKRARIWELREGGRSISWIAKEMRCHERTIYNILAGPRPKGIDAPQPASLPPLLAYIAKR
jgi:hypothetical protein